MVVGFMLQKTNLDITSDFLYDTWDDDVYYEYFDDYQALDCYDISWPWMDFGIAENTQGAVIFDFCTVAWGYDSKVMSMDARYRGALSNQRKQLFKIYTSNYMQITNILSIGCFNALNDIRKENELTIFSLNECLTKSCTTTC